MRAAEVSGPGSEAAVRLEVVAAMARTVTCDVVLVVLLLDGGSIRFGVEGRSWLDTLDTMRSELESKGIEVGSWSASPCDVGIVRLHSALVSCDEEWRCTTPGWVRGLFDTYAVRLPRASSAGVYTLGIFDAGAEEPLLEVELARDWRMAVRGMRTMDGRDVQLRAVRVSFLARVGGADDVRIEEPARVDGYIDVDAFLSSRRVQAQSTGVATRFRISDARGRAIVRGIVSRLGEGGDLQLSTVNIVATAEVEIVSLSLSVGAANMLLASYEAALVDEVL